MTSLDEFSAKVRLPPVTQIGVIVKDLEQTVSSYSTTLGLKSFGPISDLSIDHHWFQGEKSSIRLRISRVMWGIIEYELIQPVEGRSLHQEFLDTHGEGLHHLGMEVNNYEETVRTLKRALIKPLVVMEVFNPVHRGWAKATYFDTRHIGGVILEVMCRPWMAKR